ncbi:hypothetical protein QR680_016350 [Steinernema hermaphroditum]|uniref:Uncharacterized protein n=1 Tax=Steinernema hermaphroditum TaxID=289476 RepID=A0AA39LMI4_9BILA|nr:hypothetical protein QR680_016350 [Steinernema hermaphroditum]
MTLLFHLRIVLAILSATAVVLVFIEMNRQHRANTASPNITEEARKAFETVIDSVPSYRSKVECEDIISMKSKRLNVAETWNFDEKLYWQSFGEQPNICQAIKKTFGLFDKPLSQEEYEFPLAFSMLVHDNPVQILFLLSALYQPQNQFCIAIDGGASDDFQRQMYMLADCFPNIFVMMTTKVRWCDFSVLRGVYGCVQYLARLQSDWKYYQYLSGVDLPLKTNLEMVRIFKQMNGSFNAGIYDLENYRYKHHAMPPLTLWKSSLSSTFSRESANFMVSNPKVQELYDYLKSTICPDESFWATIAGNPKEIPMPGGFDAALWKQKLTGEWDHKHPSNRTVKKDNKYGVYKPEKYYISRYQIWYERKTRSRCHGKFTSGSCVFGVADLPMLGIRPELVAHKLYFSVQPGAYFCLYEHVRRRALAADTNFNVEAYGDLPGPQLLRGVPFELVDIRAPNGYEYY